jgi:hypothetical protein
MRLINGIVPVLLLALLTACSDNKSGQASEEVPADSALNDSLRNDSLQALIDDYPVPKAADELFDDFFYNFVVNRKLQLERTRFPLPVERNGKTKMVSKADWKVEHFFMRQGYYTLLFDNEKHMEIVKDTSVNHAIVEKIHFDTRNIEQYIFYRKRGAWMLTKLRQIPFSQDVNATFLTFYHQFVSDKTFQGKSLAESVKFVGPDPDDDFSMMEGIITPDTWEAFAPELPKKMIYNIIYGQPKREGDSKIFVMRGIANGLELEMTFKRMSGNWKLIKLTT